MSSLKATDGFKLKLDLVQKIIYDYTHLTNSGKICISSHVNIQGSERANLQPGRHCPHQLQTWNFQDVNEWQEI